VVVDRPRHREFLGRWGWFGEEVDDDASEAGVAGLALVPRYFLLGEETHMRD
jgi:hypothetical protein